MEYQSLLIARCVNTKNICSLTKQSVIRFERLNNKSLALCAVCCVCMCVAANGCLSMPYILFNMYIYFIMHRQARCATTSMPLAAWLRRNGLRSSFVHKCLLWSGGTFLGRIALRYVYYVCIWCDFVYNVDTNTRMYIFDIRYTVTQIDSSGSSEWIRLMRCVAMFIRLCMHRVGLRRIVTRVPSRKFYNFS